MNQSSGFIHNFEFFDQIKPKRVFPIQKKKKWKEKMEKRKTANKVYILELVYVLNFSWKNNFDFLEHISQKRHF